MCAIRPIAISVARFFVRVRLNHTQNQTRQTDVPTSRLSLVLDLVNNAVIYGLTMRLLAQPNVATIITPEY